MKKMKLLLTVIATVGMSNVVFAQWSLTGNAGTTPGTDYVGTSDNQDLVFKTNATEKVRILKTGEVGIGKVPTGLTVNPPPFSYTTYQPVLQIEGQPTNSNPGGTFPSPIMTITATGVASKALAFGVTSRGSYIAHGGTGTLSLRAKVEIGDYVANNMTTPGTYGLWVADGILTEKVKVAVKTTGNWADYVFAKDYKLLSLGEVEAYIQKNKHLPGVPSAEEVVKEGIDMATMDAKLLEKIEELTLYMIDLKKENEIMKKEIENLKLTR